MSRTIKYSIISAIIIAFLYFVSSKAFYSMQFDQAEVITLAPNESKKAIFNAMNSLSADYECDQLQDPEHLDLQIMIDFDWPLVVFNGSMSISDIGRREERVLVDRLIFHQSGRFSSTIDLKELCLDVDDSIDHSMTFRFTEETGDTYSWQFDYVPEDLMSTETIQLNLTKDEITGMNIVRRK